MDNRIFMKQGYYCKIKRDLGESYENYIKRGYFVVSQKPKNNEEYEMSLKMSRIWLNIKLNNSKYSDKIHELVQNMEKKI